jgi:large repetitive protein
LPVVVTSQGASSQAGVNIWVQPELLVTAPTALSGTVGVPWSSTNNSVTAADGDGGPYTYAVTAGTMPNGVSLTGGGAITGTPLAGSGGQYAITVTATDASQVPVTGSVQFTLSVAAGLYLTGNPSGNLMGSASTAIPDITQVTATGGTYPYTYTISVTPPGGGQATDIILDSVNTNEVDVQSTAVAGTYTVTVTATDSSSTPLTGSYSFTISLM